jgi:hypothetical protein
MTRERRGSPRWSFLMNIDQKAACRRAPKLPDGLPHAAEWKHEDDRGKRIHVFSDCTRCIDVIVESCADDQDLQEAIAEQLDATGDDSDAASCGMMGYVTPEPSMTPQDGIGLQMVVLEMLCETCDVFVLPN